MTDPHTVILYNPGAGSADELAPLEAWAEARPNVALVIPDSPEEARQHARQACQRGRLVVAAGGDGTVHDLATALLGCRGASRPRLGVLPLGTGNDLARSLGVPLELEPALAVLDAGVARTVDALRIRLDRGETEWAVNVLSGGVSGVVSRETSKESKKSLGPLAYVRGGLSAAANELEPYQVELTCDGQPVAALPLLAVLLANGRFAAGGVTVAPDAELGDGWLDVILVEDGPWWRGLELGARLLAGELTEAEGVHHRRAHRVEVRSEPPLPWTFDGEHRGAGAVEVELVPEALEVLVPDPAAAR